MKFRWGVMILFVMINAAAWCDEGKPPTVLKKLQLSWESAKQKQLLPIDKKQIESLEALIDRYSESGELGSLLAVRRELKQLKKGEEPQESKLAAGVPDSLIKLRASWIDSRKRALAPLEEKYRTALAQLVKSLTQKGDLDSASAVDAELKRISKTETKQDVTKDFTIVKAQYGSDEQLESNSAKDVTETLRTYIKDGKISLEIGRDIFGDPHPYKTKFIVVEYMEGGSEKVLTKTLKANRVLELP